MKKAILLLLMNFFADYSLAIEKSDLAFGSLKIGAHLAEIKKEYGEPLIFKVNDNPNFHWESYYLFPSFKVYVVPEGGSYSGEICSIEILDTNIKTSKGIKIGDTYEDVKKSYGELYLQDYFLSTGIFDHFFTEFTEVAYLDFHEDTSDSQGFHAVLVFYFRDKKVVRILAHETYP